MKKYKSILAAGFSALLLSGCSLDTIPYSELPTDTYVKDDATLNTLVLGVYNGLHDVMYYEWAVTELRSDNTRMHLNNSTSSQAKLVEQLDQGVINSEHAWVSEYWNASYAVIQRCNNVLEYLDAAESEENRNMYEGEVKFLRALQYFNLVRLWGPVFIVTEKMTSEMARFEQRDPVDDVYNLIETDLNAIIDGAMLPENHSEINIGRADLTAAKALLAKVYATHYQVGDEKYRQAAILCKEVLRSPKVGNPTNKSMLVPYANIFSTHNEMNPEIIFAVRYIGGNVGLGSPFGNLFAPTNNGANVILGTSSNYNFPSDNIMEAYAAGEGLDVRKDVNVAESYYNSTTGETVTRNARHIRKYFNIDQSTNPITTQYDGDADWPVIRVADIALLYAEIVNEISGPDTDAIEYLNMIRTRAGLAPYTSAEVPSRFEFRDAVRNERRLELAFENQRWFDLLRWGTAKETVNNYIASEAFYSNYSYAVNPLAEWQLVLPIPIDVININPKVAQNVGY